MNRIVKIAAIIAQGNIVSQLVYLRDEFTTAQATPLTSPRTCEPGPGNLTIIDVESKMSISGSKINFTAQITPVWGEEVMYENVARAQQAGRVVILDGFVKAVGVGNLKYGWFTGVPTASNNYGSIGIGTTTLYAEYGGTYYTEIGSIVTGTPYKLAVTQDGLYLIKGGGYPEATLLYFIPIAPGNSYAGLTDFDAICSADILKIANLGGPYATAYGIATQRLSGVRAAGDTFTHEANALLDWTTALNTSFAFRRQDDANCWRVDIAANGSLVLNEVAAGMPTARGTVGAATVVAGHPIRVIADAGVIRVFTNNVLRITYSSAAAYQTLTSGKVLSGTPSDIVAWPRTLSGAALAALNAV